jgi:hypothetical protein
VKLKAESHCLPCAIHSASKHPQRSKTSFTRSQYSGKMTKVNAPSANLFGSGSSFSLHFDGFPQTRFFPRFSTLDFHTILPRLTARDAVRQHSDWNAS